MSKRRWRSELDMEEEETKDTKLDLFDHAQVADFVQPIRHFHNFHAFHLFSFVLRHVLSHQFDHLPDFCLMCVTVSTSVFFVSLSL